MQLITVAMSLFSSSYTRSISNDKLVFIFNSFIECDKVRENSGGSDHDAQIDWQI